MSGPAKRIHSLSGALLGTAGLAIWWGLEILPAPPAESVRIRFFHWTTAPLDRVFFQDLSGSLAPAGWLVGFIFSAVCAFLIYSLAARIFPLDRLGPGKRLLLLGAIAFFILWDLNPLIAGFVRGVPAHLELYALEAAQGLTRLTALVGGLSLAVLLLQVLPPSLLNKLSQPGLLPVVAMILATAAVLFAARTRLESMQGLATVSDELSYLRQAEIFKKGLLAEPSPEPMAFFQSEQMLNDGRYYSKYPPGTSLCYLPVAALSIPKTGPLLFLVLNLWLTFLLAKRLFGRRTAYLALALSGVSPFFVLMGTGYLSHGPGLFATLLMAWFHLLWLERKSARHAFFSGLFGGLLFLIRPITAAALIVPFFVHGQIVFQGSASRRLRSILAFALPLTACVTLMLLYNYAQTHDPFLFPYEKYSAANTPYDRYGLMNLGQGALNTLFNLSRLDHWLFGFAPSLLPAAALFLLGAALSWDLLFSVAFLCLAAAYLLHWFWGTPWYGPLYYYECVAFFVILTARGVLQVHEAMKRQGKAHVLPLALAIPLLFAAPAFMASRERILSERVAALWGPVLQAAKGMPGEGAWLIMDDHADYLGAAPEWMTGGFRILTGEGRDPAELEAQHRNREIYIMQEGKGPTLLTKSPVK